MQRRPVNDLAVHCDDLSVARGGVRVVEGVTLRLEAARALALMGPTGAGKSSLAAILAGADNASLTVVGGAAHVAGISVRRGGRARRVRSYLTGYLEQGAGAQLAARMTVAELIGEPVTVATHDATMTVVAGHLGLYVTDPVEPQG